MVKKNMKSRFLPAVVSGTMLAINASPASAKLEEIIVTAQKQEESIQTVPMAISAFSNLELENKGITSFEGVVKASPSITYAPSTTSSNTLIIFMRGMGTGDPGQIAADGAVGLYQDGFYISRPQATTFDLADVERVEVLRGPQGTLYGRNTTGGTVNIISKQPAGEFGLKQNLSFGTRNLFRSLTTVDIPAWNSIATKISLLKSSIDGYVINSGSGHDFGEKEQQAGRFLLHGDVTEDIAVDYFLEMGELNDTPYYFQNASLNGMVINGFLYDHAGSPRSRTYRPIDLRQSSADFEGHGLTFSWDVNTNLTAKSLTGYRELVSESYSNPAESTTLAPGVPFSLDNENFYNTHQFSQEFQFLGALLDGRLNYVAGLYYFEESGSHLRTTNLPSFGMSQDSRVKAEAKSRAIFGQMTWNPAILEDRLELTLGARYTRDEKKGERFTQSRTAGSTIPGENGSATGSVNDLDFSRFNPSFIANYQWSSDISSYFKIATGYRAGGFIESAPPGQFDQTYSPENLTSYELGLKSYWLDQRVRMNVAGFYTKYEDIQLLMQIDPSNPQLIQTFNAGEATIKGVELNLLVAPIEDFSIGLDYSYLRATFDEVDVVPNTVFDRAVNQASPFNVGDNIKDIFVLPYAPKHSVGVTMDYTFLRFERSDITLHMDYRWRSKVYTGSTSGPAVPGREFNTLPSYGVLDGRVTWSLELPRGDRARVSVWGKNLGNKEYPVYAGANGSAFPIQSPSTGILTPAGFYNQGRAWAEPPSYGLDIAYEY